MEPGVDVLRACEIPERSGALIMDILKRIYSNSPRFMRSLYVNLYGIRNIPRFRKWDSLIDELEYTERMSREEQVDFVEKGLRKVILDAVENVPFYSKYAPLARELEEASVFEILPEFPIIDKETINRNPEAFISNKREDSVVSKTSGTTGTPLTVHMDRYTFLLTDALWWRRTRWAGYEKGDWIARVVGDPVIPLRIKEPDKPWMISRFDKRIYLSTFHLNRRAALRMGEVLNAEEPAFIMGYPSSLEILCNFLCEAGFETGWRPKKVLFSSEPMYAHQEKVIKKVFKTEIRGLFGSGEKLVSASQCDEGAYHLSLVDGFVEGQFGIMGGVQPAAATTLTNRVMPLIRYQIGDVIETLPEERCACGRTLPQISPVITKQEDWISTPSGRKISPSAVTWAFIHLEIEGINKAQVVQRDERSVKVYLNTSEDKFNKYKDILKKSMDDVFFGEMDVEIVKTDRIDIRKSGKSRFVVNELTQGK